MKVLITAGSTQVPIDAVRSMGNIFRGKTGRDIAEYFKYFIKPKVVLLTSDKAYLEQKYKQFLDVSNDRVCFGLSRGDEAEDTGLKAFRTFDDLENCMENEVRFGNYDAIIHSAAVSDYKVKRVLNENLDPLQNDGKIASSHDKLYLELVPTVKIIDQIREPWGFRGKLVKFKLQVGISDEALVKIARRSMEHSRADWIVANCLEWARERAIILGADGSRENVTREALPKALYERIAK